MRRLLSATLASVLLAACVTINVYFPEVAAERAADTIIQDVWGTGPAADGGEQGALPADAADKSFRVAGVLGRMATSVIDFVVPPAHAQQPNIDISSPAIASIRSRMQARHNQLAPFYDAGAVGLTNDAMIAVRDQNAVPLAQRNQVRQLVAEENQDRAALYREIAVANDHPEWEAQIRGTFAERWIANARGGWWYMSSGGGWTQK